MRQDQYRVADRQTQYVDRTAGSTNARQEQKAKRQRGHRKKLRVEAVIVELIQVVGRERINKRSHQGVSCFKILSRPYINTDTADGESERECQHAREVPVLSYKIGDRQRIIGERRVEP